MVHVCRRTEISFTSIMTSLTFTDFIKNICILYLTTWYDFDVTWTSRRLKSPVTRLLVGQRFQINHTWDIKVPHDDVIKWKHFPRYWPFVRGIHRSPVNFPHKGRWRRALMFSLICARINGWVNNREAGDLRRHRAHCNVIVILPAIL